MKGNNPKNLKQHLMRCHKTEYQQLLEKEEEIKSNKEKLTSSGKSRSKQLELTGMLKTVPLSRDGPRYKAITTKLALFIATANVSYSLVENDELRDLFFETEPRYPVPGRGRIRIEVQQLVHKVKEEIKQLLKLAQQVHITCDIWSKKGMSESFLGIVVHFFEKQQRQHATLAVRNIYGSHTALNILSVLKEVMMEWSIPKEAIGEVITDNGSNML